METTVGVTQLIELGGKRGSRMDIADQGLTLSKLGLEAERLNLIRDVTVAFVEVAASEEHLKIVGEQRDLAEDVFGEVSKRVSVAREPAIQQNKAEVTRATARIAYETAEREVTQAKRKLVSLWGGNAEPVVLDTGALFELKEPPPAPALESSLSQNPDLTRWDAEVKRSQASYDLERANAIPDPRISAGMRDFRESGDKAFVAGLSIPIPIFNMNRGNIEKARHNITKAESDAQTTKLQLGADLNQRYQEMNIAYIQAESLEHKIIPAAEKSFRLSRAGYREGKFAFLEVLDAERTLFDAKEQRVTALKNYHVSRAEVERLTAVHFSSTKINEEPHE
jgi:cobalt-zinc-cadmium efflux system outer membrane protein